MTPAQTTLESIRLSRERLRGRRPERRLRGRNSTKADILVYRLEATRVVVKDYSARPWWLRNTVGRWSVRRECRAYQAANGLAGLPRFHGRLGPHALALQYIEARPLAGMHGERVDPAVFDRLDDLLDGLHRRGIALTDLHHRDVLVTSNGDVFVVDLAAAWLAPSGSGWLRRRIFRRLARLDRLAAARLRARWSGTDAREAMERVDPAMARWHRRGRRIRRVLERLRGRR